MYECVVIHISVYSHDVHRDGRGQALADVFEEVIGGQQVGAPRNQVLLELQQLSPPTQKHLRHTHTHTVSVSLTDQVINHH